MDNWEKFQSAYNSANQGVKDFIDSSLAYEIASKTLARDNDDFYYAIIPICDYVLGLIDSHLLMQALQCTDGELQLLKKEIGVYIATNTMIQEKSTMNPDEQMKPLTREEVLAVLAPKRTMGSDTGNVGEEGR